MYTLLPQPLAPVIMATCFSSVRYVSLGTKANPVVLIVVMALHESNKYTRVPVRIEMYLLG